MAVVKIEEVFLYFSDVTDDAAENLSAAAFMDHSEIPYTRLLYNDADQCKEVLDAVNTWWAQERDYAPALPPVTKYPFLVYTEVHDNVPARYSPIRYLEGLEAIKTFADIYAPYK
jgi:hypothetical protein